jgi:hypothetical protein
MNSKFNVLIILIAVAIIGTGIFFILDNVLGIKSGNFNAEVVDKQVTVTHSTSKDSDGHTHPTTTTHYYIWFKHIEYNTQRVTVSGWQYFSIHNGEIHIFTMRRGRFTHIEYFGLVK